MKRFFCLSLSAIFMFGILFNVSRTSEGKSPFIEQIKKIFHYSSGETGKEGTKASKGPFMKTGKGGEDLLQEIKNIFHYFPEDK